MLTHPDCRDQYYPNGVTYRNRRISRKRINHPIALKARRQKHRFQLSSRAGTILIILAAILLLSILSPRVFASDDSNPGGFIVINNTVALTANSNQTLTTLDQLSQSSGNNTQYNQAANDTQYKQLLNQLNSQLQAGNNIGAQQTVAEMQNYLGTPQGGQLSPSLRAFIQSMTVGSSGLSVNPTLLEQLIGTTSGNGIIPPGLAGMDPTQAAKDLSTMASGLNGLSTMPSQQRGIDQSTASNFLRDASQIRQALGIGLLGGGPTGGGSQSIPTPQIPKLPSISNIPNISGLGAKLGQPILPNVQAVVPGVPSLSIGLGLPILPIILVAIVAVAGFILLNRRRFGFLARRVTPSSIRLRPLKPEFGLNLQNPRDLVIFYFRKVVGAMHNRGVLRLDPETHREFSEKCSPRPEAPPVKNISVLFEKAMFSGSEVTMPEADFAREYSVQVENTVSSTKRNRSLKPRSDAKTSKIG